MQWQLQVLLRLPPSSGNLRCSAQKHQLVSRPCNCPLCSSRLKKVKCKTPNGAQPDFCEDIYMRRSPKEKTRSPMATAAWLTLLGPPSRCTVHHISTPATWDWKPVDILTGREYSSQFHLFLHLPQLISQDRLLLPSPPSPKVTPLPENLQQGFSKVTCLLLQSETRSHFKVDIGWHFGLSTISAGHFSLIHMSKVFMRRRVRNQVVQMKDYLLMHHLQLHNWNLTTIEEQLKYAMQCY